MVQENGKEQLIVAIRGLNRTASEAFLSQFSEVDLREYLGNLRGSNPSYRTFSEAKTPGKRQAAGVV